jgi:hypothetical protein
MAHCFVLSLAAVGSGAFEALLQEFLKDDQQEFVFSTTKKKTWSRKRTAFSRE